MIEVLGYALVILVIVSAVAGGPAVGYVMMRQECRHNRRRR